MTCRGQRFGWGSDRRALGGTALFLCSDPWPEEEGSVSSSPKFCNKASIDSPSFSSQRYAPAAAHSSRPRGILYTKDTEKVLRCHLRRCLFSGNRTWQTEPRQRAGGFRVRLLLLSAWYENASQRVTQNHPPIFTHEETEACEAAVASCHVPAGRTGAPSPAATSPTRWDLRTTVPVTSSARSRPRGPSSCSLSDRSSGSFLEREKTPQKGKIRFGFMPGQMTA